MGRFLVSAVIASLASYGVLAQLPPMPPIPGLPGMPPPPALSTLFGSDQDLYVFKSKAGAEGFPATVNYYMVGAQVPNFQTAEASCATVSMMISTVTLLSGAPKRMGWKLWCPQTNHESQIVFANTAYTVMADIIDGNAKMDSLKDFFAMTQPAAYIGIKRKDGKSGGEMADYECKNPIAGRPWNFEKFTARDEKNPWEARQPARDQKEKCVVVGKHFSTKWHSEKCDMTGVGILAAPISGAPSTGATPVSEEQAAVNSLMPGARPICMSISSDAEALDPTELDEEIYKKVKNKLNSLRNKLARWLMFAFLVVTFMGTGGFCCLYCCYCCCCCGAPCKKKPEAGVVVETGRPMTAPTDFAAPPPPPMQPQQVVQPVMQPVMQPMMMPMQQQMAPISINMSNNNG